MTVVVKKSPALYIGKKQKAAAISRKRVNQARKDPSSQLDTAPVDGELLKEKIKRARSSSATTAAVNEIEKISETVAAPQQKNAPAYSTTIPLKAIEKAGKKASTVAMEMMGYSIVEAKGWLVKKYANGAIEKISKI